MSPSVEAQGHSPSLFTSPSVSVRGLLVQSLLLARYIGTLPYHAGSSAVLAPGWRGWRMPYWRQVIVSRDMAVLGGVVVTRRQAWRKRGRGAQRLFIMAQGAGLLIGAAVPLWLQLPLLPVPEMKRLPGRGH